VEELSQALSMSRKNLHRKIKALTGQTPSLFIRVIRLQEAKILLESGDYTVQEAAYRVGFNSATYFSTCFSAQFGYAPSDEYAVKK
jgi:AraC-like DNA-binding protein